jgi:O-antigen/teichoic acid export membrane protein
MRLAEKVALNSAAQLGGQVAVGFASLASVAVTARYLDVDQYGSLLAAIAFVSIFSMLAEFGVPPTAARAMARRPELTERIAASVLVAGAALALLSLAVAIAGGTWIYSGRTTPWPARPSRFSRSRCWPTRSARWPRRA